MGLVVPIITLVMVASFALQSVTATTIVPLEKVVRWKSSDAKPPETLVKNGTGVPQYRIALVPLWRLEGGVVAIEIELTSPGDQSANRLGERKGKQPQAFVVELSDLQPGSTSPFGKTRTFSFPDLPQVYFRVEFRDTRLSKGAAGCASCQSIEQFTAVISVGASSRN